MLYYHLNLWYCITCGWPEEKNGDSNQCISCYTLNSVRIDYSAYIGTYFPFMRITLANKTANTTMKGHGKAACRQNSSLFFLFSQASIIALNNDCIEIIIEMALVHKVHIQGALPQLPHNHQYISSCKLQLAEISTAATYVLMVMWNWWLPPCVYFVDQRHPYILLISMKCILLVMITVSLLLAWTLWLKILILVYCAIL